MPPSDGAILADGAILVDLAEFMALADRLRMPESERQGILGVSEAGLSAISAPRIDSAELQTQSFRRRLTYVLPLMRRAVANDADVGNPLTIGPDRTTLLS